MSSLIDHFGINWSSVAERSLSVLIYLILQVLKVSDKNQNIIFKACNLSKSRTAKFWLTKNLNQEYDGLHNDGRGGQRNDFFYDIYPDIESEAKLYAMTCASITYTQMISKSVQKRNFVHRIRFKHQK